MSRADVAGRPGGATAYHGLYADERTTAEQG